MSVKRKESDATRGLVNWQSDERTFSASNVEPIPYCTRHGRHARPALVSSSARRHSPAFVPTPPRVSLHFSLFLNVSSYDAAGSSFFASTSFRTAFMKSSCTT